MNIKTKDIVPDIDQPRKYFPADKMQKLLKSIEREGIINPLILEELEDGKYLLIDGERRYRVALELGLKEVPAVVEEKRDVSDRRLRRFAIQEQHEGWTPVEKAMELQNLSSDLKISMSEICAMVGATRTETGRYMAFADMADKEAYLKSEVPIDWAILIRSSRNCAKRIKEEVLQEKFDRSDEKRFERKILSLVKEGHIVDRNELVRLKDAFTKNPKTIDKFLDNKDSTPQSLFVESKAKGAYHLRNVVNNALYITSHGRKFLQLKDVRLTDEQMKIFGTALEIMQEIINLK
jgi:ParB/RepB/Spo0J family partition protein